MTVASVWAISVAGTICGLRKHLCSLATAEETAHARRRTSATGAAQQAFHKCLRASVVLFSPCSPWLMTEANAVSSRSHAVCLIRIRARGSHGLLVLVDCAGSERRKAPAGAAGVEMLEKCPRRQDSMYHSKERQQESAEINASFRG